MNLRFAPGLLAWMLLSSAAHSCGPMFPDTILDRPRAALDAPEFNFTTELHRLAGIRVSNDNVPREAGLLGQLARECSELQIFWKERKLATAEIERHLNDYRAIRTSLLGDNNPEEISRKYFPSQAPNAAGLTPSPLGPEFPKDIADYVEAARLYATDHREEARELWKSIATRPPEQRRFRGVWACWMLAKTSSKDDECLDYYRQVVQQADSGCQDVLGLKADALGWLAPLEADLISGLQLLYTSFQSGRTLAARDIHYLTFKLLYDGTSEQHLKAAADPIVRPLLNLRFQTLSPWSDQPDGELPDWAKSWLNALEQNAPLPLADGSRIAWAAYQAGHYEQARHWLDLSNPDDPISHWLESKFSLRAGKNQQAADHLAQAIQHFRKASVWHPGNHPEPYLSSQVEANCQGRLLAEQAVLNLSSRDFSSALTHLIEGGYRLDASYLAERVLTTDELIAWTGQHASTWKVPTPTTHKGTDSSEEETEEETVHSLQEDIDASNCFAPHDLWIDSHFPENQIRWLLARRLAREGRLEEAAAYMPPILSKLFDHYRALDRERKSGKWQGTALAAIQWRLARIHRRWGAELFSTEAAPDGAIWNWSYEVTEFSQFRKFSDGWITLDHDYSADGSEEIQPALFAKDRAVPSIDPEELSRVQRNHLRYEWRFHYRYVAVDLALEAAAQLPDDHPQLAQLYNTVGLWIADRNPAAADRVYQTLIRRAGKSALGVQADQKRWFLREVPALEDLDSLPESLAPKKPAQEGVIPSGQN